MPLPVIPTQENSVLIFVIPLVSGNPSWTASSALEAEVTQA